MSKPIARLLHVVCGVLALAAYAQEPGPDFHRTLPRFRRSELPPAPVLTMEDGRAIVPSQRPWSDTGLDLQKGQHVSISATGQIRGCHGPADDWAYGPRGPEGKEDDTKRIFCLVGKIEGLDGGREFYVGKSLSFEAALSGRLCLGISDIYHLDNEGAFIVDVKINGASVDFNHLPQRQEAREAKGEPKSVRIALWTEDVMREFHILHREAWRPRGNELLGTSVAAAEPTGHHRRLPYVKKLFDPDPMLTYGTYFRSLNKVVIRGRIVPSSRHNFRISVGSINMILNWECADENHYRNGNACTVQRGHVLTPGKTHTIAVEQQGQDAVVLVDNVQVYRTKARLEGTVTVYPSVGSTIAISELIVEGEAVPGRPVKGHSHPNTF